MHTCPSCQAQMLEYLYDLLDATERQAMQDHLDACPACRAELARARDQQQLLAAAARMEFPDVRFTARPVGTAPPVAVAGRRADAAAGQEGPPLAALGRGRRRPAGRSAAYRPPATGWNATTPAPAAPSPRSRRPPRPPGEQMQRRRARRCRTCPRQEQKEGRMRPATPSAPASSSWPSSARRRSRPARRRLMRSRPPTSTISPSPPTSRPAWSAKTDSRSAIAIPVVKAADGKYTLTLPADLPVKPDSQLTLVVSASARAASGRTVSEEVNLVAPVYVTHLETDKPMYQPGEVVHYRSLTLDRFSLKPADEDLRLTYELVTPTRGRCRRWRKAANGLRDAQGATARGGRRTWGRTASRSAASAPANSPSTRTWRAASTPWFAARRTTASPNSAASSSSITIRNRS